MGSSGSKVKEPPGSHCWSDLPLDLAGLVLLRLHTHADHVRFGSVCRHWRHAAKLLHSPSSPPPLPWLNFRDGTFERLADGKRHGLRLEAYEQCRGSFDSWVLLEDVRGGRRSHYLKNPLTGDVVRLPGRCKEPVRRGGDVDARVVPPSSTTFHLRKVVMCANGLVAAKISYHELPDVVVFCWPGMSSWPAGICNGTWYHDMARYKGKMYAVSRRGDLYEHELRRDTSTGEPVVTRVERVILAPLSAEGFPPEAVTTLDGPYAAVVCARTCYLVVSRGKLLMVRWIVPSASARDWADTMAFKVFEADLEMSKWDIYDLFDNLNMGNTTDVATTAVVAANANVALGAELVGFLDGFEKETKRTMTIPDMDGKELLVPNPDYTNWMVRDQVVLGFLSNSLSPEVLGSWILELCVALSNTKKGNRTAADYFSKMVQLGDEIVAPGKELYLPPPLRFRRRRHASSRSSYRYGGVSSSGYRSVRARPKLRYFLLGTAPTIGSAGLGAFTPSLFHAQVFEMFLALFNTGSNLST
ncbi:hypothetical protein QYE76_017733 [Lolium multiflorum]|uniref:DUF295 domain-containing protein n=1 Tax=Lolium multiflorum TaxID=4521 RepID=A0AAD8QH80_LOLMU|nr:hypothetical protein QYE76_017733 [Lolium multiflorum]